MGRTLTALLMVAGLAAAAGCAEDGVGAPATTVGDDGGETRSSSPSRVAETSGDVTSVGDGVGGGGRFVRAVLAPFDDCSAFVDHVKSEARDRVGPYGLDQNGWWHFEEVAVDEMATAEVAAEEPAEEPASEPAPNRPADGDSSDDAGGDSGSSDYTGTNVQELGVDEPDIIKTDGDRILVVRDDRLIHIDISDGTPRITDEITIPDSWGHELFFVGDRAVLFSNGGSFEPLPVEPLGADAATTDAEAGFSEPADPSIAPGGWTAPAATIVEVDLRDPFDLKIPTTMEIEGQYLSARRVDNMVRLALTTSPTQLPWVFPQSQAGEERAEQTNRELVAETTIEDWVPDYRLTSGSASSAGPLLDCDNLHRPVEFSGFDVVTVLDINLDAGLGEGFDPTTTTGVLASGQTVYSSLDRFYVATTKWIHQDQIDDGTVPREWSDDYETELHAFAIAPGERARYTASGSVAGSLLNQFSLDEHDGYLRAVTTDGSPWDQGNLSESGLTVFAEDGEQLVQVGHVGGLGKGEQLYSARLLDDVGFAVTFRQIDPFYIIDLSDPRNPRVTGELKIPGFSTYLHPLDGDRVLGIGQDATEEGRVQGLKVSMFDVSDPTNPRETAVWTLPGANSPAEYDHRAFQMWGSTAILPVEDWNTGFNGVVLLDTSDGITETGRLSHAPFEGTPSSDCRTITPDDELPEDSELFWMAQDATMHVQICGSDDTGGWPGHYCDPVPFENMLWWGGDEAVMEDALRNLGATEGDRIEMCWWEGDHANRVERSLVADGVLYTLTYQAIQANRFDDLALVANVALR